MNPSYNKLKHTPFLSQVANYYSDKSVENFCFIFPNRRSGQFFLKYYQEVCINTFLQPHITTITDFIEDNHEATLASPVELIFNLYQALCEAAHLADYPFDRFVHWGNTIISDFNDVNLYLADAKQLFTNIADIKDISTDYLPDELKAELQKYFNIRFEHTDSNSLWKHRPDTNSNTEVQNNFTNIWSILYNVYTNYHQRLEQNHLAYPGKMLRDLVNRMAKNHLELPFERYVFVGFNMLSIAEFALFNAFKKSGKADFFFDNASPAFKNHSNIGQHYINHYAEDFKAPINLELISDFPNIYVRGISSNIGQTKYAFKLVDKLIQEGHTINKTDALDTAIVLPDEMLFPSLINSVPPHIENVNATLGILLRNSDIAQLIRNISKVHKNAYRKSGEQFFSYYKEFVRSIISHPIIKSIFPADVLTINKIILSSGSSYISETAFQGTALKDIFTTITNTEDKSEVIDFINRLIKLCQKVVDSNPHSQPSLQSNFCEQYIDILEDTKLLINNYGIPMCESSLFFLFDRLTSLYTIPFEGEPLSGIQIMGMLETRNLDFKNLIILSMNERIFPKKHFKNSFIPPNIRRGFGMSTIDEQESISAYYFYRLISRAENVYLLYNTNPEKIGSNEYSRFVSQLKLVYGCNIHARKIAPVLAPDIIPVISVPKTDKIMEQLNHYLTDSPEKLYFSASSLKTLIKCPLMFYIKYVERISDEQEKDPFMDAATFGSIVHDTLKDFYYPEGIAEGAHHQVFKTDIQHFKKHQLDATLIKHINTDYLHKQNENEPLMGETAITFEALKYYAEQVLNYDLNLLPNDTDFFEIYRCEVKKKVELQIGDHKVNFEYIIDRLDRINNEGPMRIIDYKTGKDDVSFQNIDTLFKSKLAIMQLFLYCNAYEAETHDVKMGLTPIIYKIKDMATSGIKYNKKMVENYQLNDKLNQEFMAKLGNNINELFNPQKPFEQKPSEKTCKFCKFKDICRR
ncbi:MAG: PD-(D/E)XK nuclease family protein [Sodaliphilus sp.]